MLPSANVITNGAGWYTYVMQQQVTMKTWGHFPDGNDKGYRFRWSTFGNTTLNQLPYVQGVSSNDQIAQQLLVNSHYVVYNVRRC